VYNRSGFFNPTYEDEMSTLPRAGIETTHAGTATTELLDHPIWAALTTKNRDLAEGGPLALRYLPDVAPLLPSRTGQQRLSQP
jgi:hypothetical protein